MRNDVIRKFTFGVLLFQFVFFGCQTENDQTTEKKSKDLSENTDLRKSLNGHWSLISQSFTKGRKLEKFPVAGTVDMFIDANDRWCTFSNEDTISYGTLKLIDDNIQIFVEFSEDEMSVQRIDGKVSATDKYFQLEGKMHYTTKSHVDYTHMIFGKSYKDSK